eukprot:g8108.t1
MPPQTRDVRTNVEKGRHQQHQPKANTHDVTMTEISLRFLRLANYQMLAPLPDSKPGNMHRYPIARELISDTADDV